MFSRQVSTRFYKKKNGTIVIHNENRERAQ